MPSKTTSLWGKQVDEELKKKWEAEDRAYKEKITQEAQEHADAFVKSSAEWQKKLAEEHGLTYEPTMSLEKQAAHIRDTMVEYQLKSRETTQKMGQPY